MASPVSHQVKCSKAGSNAGKPGVLFLPAAWSVQLRQPFLTLELKAAAAASWAFPVRGGVGVGVGGTCEAGGSGGGEVNLGHGHNCSAVTLEVVENTKAREI